MTNNEIGDRIKNRRKELGLTLQEIATKVGVASSTIQRYENGTISQYKLPVLESIAKAINVNPVWLVKEHAPMEIKINDQISITKSKSIAKDNKSNIITHLTNAEQQILNNFNKLNDLGKDEANKRVSELTEISKYISYEKEEYTLAAHDDNLSKETAKITLEKAKAIFKQMDEKE